MQGGRSYWPAEQRREGAALAVDGRLGLDALLRFVLDGGARLDRAAPRRRRPSRRPSVSARRHETTMVDSRSDAVLEILMA